MVGFMGFQYKDFIPKSFSCFKEGYSKNYLYHDLFAGISIGVISLPLCLAFAIASGVSPDRGLFTAIVAGFLISLLGGSRVQIGGPTSAFVVVIYATVEKHGYEGLALATLIAAVLLIIMGLARFGILLKFIPFAVTTGFTTGIAFLLVFSQIKDFFGLEADKVPPTFIGKCNLYCQIVHTWNIWAIFIAFSTLIFIFGFRYYLPKWPGPVFAIVLAMVATHFFGLPIETVVSKFGEISTGLPHISLPFFSYELFKNVFPDAITIALLGAIESLLSASVADALIGTKHRSNMELVAQGFANIGSVLFGGIPATGAISRTAANIKFGAKTPAAGMIHSITVLLLILFCSEIAGKIPLASLAGVLIFIAWNMSELPHFVEIIRGNRMDAVILLTTFFLTILVDLSTAVQVGIILSAMDFIKKMTNETSVKIYKELLYENEHEGAVKDSIPYDLPDDVVVFEIAGPFFYSVADLLDEALQQLDQNPRVFLLRLNKTSLIDSTGLRAIKKFALKCQSKGIQFFISDLDKNYFELFQKINLEELIGPNHLFKDFNSALAQAKSKTS